MGIPSRRLSWLDANSGLEGAAKSGESAVDRGRVQRLNDLFRRQFFMEGDVFISPGVQALPDDFRHRVLVRVRTFSDFQLENSEAGEHNVGNFELDGKRFRWTIVYSNLSLTGRSEDPSDLSKTRRVLNIMLEREP